MPHRAPRSILRRRTRPDFSQYASLRNERAAAEGRIQIVPQVGHALVEQTVRHMQCSGDLKPDRRYVLTDT